ncbi:MAG: threonine synthase [Eubacteriales bacterium]
MKLVSTRNNQITIGALDAVLKGISQDGGLFIPEKLPSLSLDDIASFKDLSYPELAAEILSLFFEEIEKSEMLEMTKSAYASFDVAETVPIKKLEDDLFVMELFHGPTLAFKDVALQMLPRLMAKALEAQGSKEDVLILTATSGDTGKAALEGFCDVDRVKIVVFYPNDGVSDMQKLQMVTQEGDNTFVYAVNGNFDDTQNGVKAIFTDPGAILKLIQKGYMLSSANSINIGRLTPQVVYYFWAYLQLVKSGVIEMRDAMDAAVPTGNFGNILAAYYARAMGLPIGRLVCASNSNKVLTDFFESKNYSIKDRAFIKTASPSMDILISSNLERLVADMVGSDAVVRDLMHALKTQGVYDIAPYMDKEKAAVFYAGWASEPDTKTTIKNTFEDTGYLLDPHTAVGVKVAKEYLAESKGKNPCVVAATASPYKFSCDVLGAFEGEKAFDDAFLQAEKLAKMTKTTVPEKIAELKHKKTRHTGVIEKREMLDAILADI